MTDEPLPAVGQTVNARIDFYNDLRDEGLGVEHCAKRGDTLVVRRIVPGIKNCLVVSHEDVTDGRGFCVAPHEIDYVYPVAQPANTDSVPGSPLGSGARPDQPKLPESGGICGSSIGLGAEGEQ